MMKSIIDADGKLVYMGNEKNPKFAVVAARPGHSVRLPTAADREPPTPVAPPKPKASSINTLAQLKAALVSLGILEG